MTFLSRFTEPSYALLRIVSGAIFTFHGVQKIFGILTDHQPPLGSQLWIGGLIELVTGLLSLFMVLHFGATPTAVVALILVWTLITLTVIDLDEQLLPDQLTLPLLWLGLLVNIGGMFTDLTSAVIGAAAGYLSLWFVFQVFRLLTGREGMGYGDFKLIAVFGAFLGWQMLPLVVLLSSFIGAIVGVGMIVFLGRDRQIPIPFGPYLAVAGLVALLWGEQINSAYLQLAGLA